MLIKLQQSPTRNWSQRSQGVGRDPALGSRPRSIGKPIAKESPFIDTSSRTRKRVPNLWVTTPLWGHDPSMGSRPLRIHDPSKGSRPIYGVTTPLVSRLETLSNQIQWTIAYCRPFSNLLTRFCDGCGRNGNPTERVVEIWLRKDDVGSFFFPLLFGFQPGRRVFGRRRGPAALRTAQVAQNALRRSASVASARG